MATLNRYSTGNTVYRGGSNAPTRGKVNPLGYVDREMRSRLAQTALQRLKQPRTSAISSNIAKQVAAVKAPVVKAPVVKPGVQRSVVPSATGALEYGANNAASYVAKKPAAQKVAAPTIDYSKLLAALTTEQLPFDENIANDQVNLDNSKIDFNAQISNNRAKLALEKARVLRDINSQELQSVEDTRDNFAARGMVYSGGYGKAFGDNERNFANARSDVDSGSTQGTLDLDLAEQSFGRQYTAGQDSLTRRAAALAEQRAGQLRLQKEAADAVEAERVAAESAATVIPEAAAEQAAIIPEVVPETAYANTQTQAPTQANSAPATNAAPRAETRVELIRKEQVAGRVNLPALAAKYKLSIPAIVKILQGR